MTRTMGSYLETCYNTNSCFYNKDSKRIGIYRFEDEKIHFLIRWGVDIHSAVTASFDLASRYKQDVKIFFRGDKLLVPYQKEYKDKETIIQNIISSYSQNKKNITK